MNISISVLDNGYVQVIYGKPGFVIKAGYPSLAEALKETQRVAVAMLATGNEWVSIARGEK